MYYCVHTPSLSSFRHVTIRRRGSARAQQSTDSSVGARVSMSPTGWLSPSIPPPTPLDHLYLSVSQAALKSEVKRICLLKAVVRQLVQFSDVDIMNVGCCGYKNSFFFTTTLAFLFPQERLRFRPCSTSPTSRRVTLYTVTSPLSQVSSSLVTVLVFPLRFHCWRLRIAINIQNVSSVFVMNGCLDENISLPHAGYIPGAGIPLQKQLEHANQQSGFTDAVRIFDM